MSTRNITPLLLFLSILFAGYSNAQITSSLGRFTFCPGESVTLTCSMTLVAHVWESSAFTTRGVVLVQLPRASINNNNINFEVATDDGINVLTSTMTFTASESLIGNETVISCSNISSDISGERSILSSTVHIFGTISPPHMPNLMRAVGNYTRLTLTFQPPLYGHECVTGYSVIGPNQIDSLTTTIVITGLNLCKSVYNFSLFARTASSNGNGTSVLSSVPDFTDLGRVSNLSVSSDGYLRWSPPPNAPEDCISGYTIQWSGSSVSILRNVTSVAESILISESNNSLPFCVEVPTTILPSVPVVPSPLDVSQNDPPVPLVYLDPAFPAPFIIVRADGRDIDTVVSWQDVSLFTVGQITSSVGIFDQTECQVTVMYVTGNSQVLGSECSKTGTFVEYCVVFQYVLCNKTSVLGRQLPSFNVSAVTTPESPESTTDSITLQLEFENISGVNCSVSGLCVQSALLLNNIVATTTDPRAYTAGSNEFVFTGVTSGTTYNYQINITEGGNVIATYTGSATSARETLSLSMSEAIGITFTITFILALVVGFGLGVVASHCHKRFSRVNNNEETTVQLEGQFYKEVSHSKPTTEKVSMDLNVAYSSVKH